jgi:hypothetical protein
MTLAQIKAHGPCHLHDAPLDTFVSLGDIAAHYDAADAWWCVRALDWNDIAIRRKVISVLLLSVKRAAKHTTDQRVHDCIAALGKWCAGDDSVDLQAAAWTAAAAARATRAETAWAAAWAAEREQQKADLITAFPPMHPYA